MDGWEKRGLNAITSVLTGGSRERSEPHSREGGHVTTEWRLSLQPPEAARDQEGPPGAFKGRVALLTPWPQPSETDF